MIELYRPVVLVSSSYNKPVEGHKRCLQCSRHLLHLMNADWVPRGRHSLDQATRCGLWFSL